MNDDCICELIHRQLAEGGWSEERHEWEMRLCSNQVGGTKGPEILLIGQLTIVGMSWEFTIHLSQPMASWLEAVDLGEDTLGAETLFQLKIRQDGSQDSSDWLSPNSGPVRTVNLTIQLIHNKQAGSGCSVQTLTKVQINYMLHYLYTHCSAKATCGPQFMLRLLRSIVNS